IANGLRRRRKSLRNSFRRVDIHKNLLRLVARWRQTIDASAFQIDDSMSAYPGIVPVANKDRSIGSSTNICGPKPRIGRCHRGLHLGCIARAFRLEQIGVDSASSGFSVQQMAAVFVWEQLPFIDDQSTRSTGTQPSNVGNDSRKFRMEMRSMVDSP